MIAPLAHKGSWPLLALLVPAALAVGHPVPDVPVRGYFSADGQARIEIEVDPRCFSEDPLNEPYLTKEQLDQMPEAERATLREQAVTFADRTAGFHFTPVGRFVPDFEFSFGGHAGAALEADDDPVMLIGRWTTRLAAGLTGYKVEARPEGRLSVVVINTINDQPVERIHVLFPGETSYVLDLTDLAETSESTREPGAIGATGGVGATFAGFVRQGFVHVLPFGMDHILFVLGLFLLSRDWKPLVWQVTMFTVAHTLTLAFATLGHLSAPGEIVEPVIAASIAVIALENIWHARYTPWRLVVVFVFGLVHGLGFAGALQELNLPTTSLLVGLLGFNVGVEFGQLAIIGLALLATCWLKNDATYRKVLVVPGSCLIAGVGAWWTIERIFFR